ncbi:hypothetical protein SLS53_008389 [Cytospora paraplurivora]|uniref:Uncharacterized protein n=1 Tax=Cytospora paraplurivora TaxID=2898453 RepID=A0AAN9U0L3_9PEZI
MLLSGQLQQAWETSPVSAGSKPGPSYAYVGQSQRPDTAAYYHAALNSLLNALRQGDGPKLYSCLLRLVRGHDDDSAFWYLAEVLAAIPATTFSEILRCFDPYNVCKDIDTAPGIGISYGAAVHTPLGDLINKWGVKVLYVRIFNRLRRMQEARRHGGIRPLLNDYIILMKCAGATSDIRAAKEIWYAMKDDGYSNWRHSEAFGEFVKARYLAEKLYSNNDLARLRVRPLDMHRSSIKIPGGLRLRLQHLRSNMTQLQRHRFGENMHERYFSEPLTRLLRKRNPLIRLENRARLLGMLPGDEGLLCAFLKANGRSGRLEASNLLLKAHWGILIHRDGDSGTIQIDGGLMYPEDSPRAPTGYLLDAVVHCYCCMGEITMAAKLVDFISRRYSIPVPDQVWSDLLEYTRIMQTKPAASEWAIARFHQKVAKADTFLDVWDLCTQEPHNFQPGLQDYYNLIKTFIRKGGSVKKPIEALRQIKPLYDEAVRACEEAWCELLQTTIQDVANHAAYRRYRELQARKDHIWYCFHYSSRQILNMTRPGRVDDDGGAREIPTLVGEFGQFLPRWIGYQIATGYVEFASDHSLQSSLVEVNQVVEESMPLSQCPPDVKKSLDQEECTEDERDDDCEVDKGYLPTPCDDMHVGAIGADSSGHKGDEQPSPSRKAGLPIPPSLFRALH